MSTFAAAPERSVTFRRAAEVYDVVVIRHSRRATIINLIANLLVPWFFGIAVPFEEHLDIVDLKTRRVLRQENVIQLEAIKWDLANLSVERFAYEWALAGEARRA
jgi:hypothetical protein